jgi:hypothetical protein
MAGPDDELLSMVGDGVNPHFIITWPSGVV